MHQPVQASALAQGDAHTHLPDVWGWLVLQYNIKSMVDIGCGYGYALRWFSRMGVDALGVDGDPNAIGPARTRGTVIFHDYTTGPLRLPAPRDLAISLEFVEHVDAQYEANWLATLAECSYVLMSHAPPGQTGVHHVNCQLSEYWIAKLEAEGFRYLPEVTALCRSTNTRLDSPWCRGSLLFFERTPRPVIP